MGSKLFLVRNWEVKLVFNLFILIILQKEMGKFFYKRSFKYHLSFTLTK